MLPAELATNGVVVGYTLVVVVNAFLVDQGHFAHHNAAPSSHDAASVGETDPVLKQAEFTGHRSNPSALIAALESFFKDNPSWSGDVEIRTRESLLAALKDFFKDNPSWQ
jgi:hypothetical protein